MKVKSVKHVEYLDTYVYDLNIEDNHNYFVGKWGINCHNSGKSFVARKTTLGHGLRLVNTDTMFEHLMNKAGMDLNMVGMTEEQITKKDEIRKKAKEITNKMKQEYINGRIGIVIDGTGRDYNAIKIQKDTLEDLGYDTSMVFVNTSLDTALARNKMRKRSVPEDLVKKFWKSVQSNMGKFQKLFGGNNFIIIDNNVPIEDKELFSDVWKDIKKFAKRPIKNHTAKLWIETEKAKKKK